MSNQISLQQGPSELERVAAAHGLDATLRPNTCRWCLRPFDRERLKPRAIAERGALRTRLMMADNGSELIICDECWPGATGHLSMIGNQIVPCLDPAAVPNPLLRQASV